MGGRYGQARLGRELGKVREKLRIITDIAVHIVSKKGKRYLRYAKETASVAFNAKNICN